MGSCSAERALQLPLRVHGIQLGRPVDLLLHAAEWRVLGFDILCGDETHRFLPFTTARIGEDDIVAGSALMLLEDLEFYRARTRSLRALLGTAAARDGSELGTLRDLDLASDGSVAALVLERDGIEAREAPGPPAIVASRDAA